MQLNDEIKKNNPFKVPEGYFDTLTERTMSAIRESGEEADAATEKEKPVRRQIRLVPFFSLAAVIIGFAVIATVMVRVVTADRAATEHEAGNGLYAELAAEELDTYMIEYELMEAEEAEITETGQGISSEIIIDYLMTEDIDINDIYELL